MTPTSSNKSVVTAPVEQPQAVAEDAQVIESTQRATRAARRRILTRRLLGSLGGAVIVLWGSASLAFLAQLALPGDRATAILNIRSGQVQARTPEELAPINEQFGLQNPIVVQYFDYLAGLLRGELGTSYLQFKPVWDVIGEQLGATLALTVTAILLSWLLMIVWVTLTAGRSPRLREFGSAIDTLTAGLPQYWLGILLLLVFAFQLGWFPVMGGSGVDALLLPALTLAIPLAGFMGQAVRTEFERTLEQPFVLSARMRGMSDLQIRLSHVLRHASLPAITLTGWALGATISGAVIVESVFSRPGIGKTLIDAVGSRDLPVVTGVVVLVAAIYVLANLLVDLLYALIDPRLKTS
ncbi:ABC transporter permease [Gulosibacter chungangensis]|uniref:ABC transporter permease n=1 Tax=Gulosibacter chungangensis TaxID=979746 RepID=A0A7J5BFK4_9MICO|nr:ABC transporter permease [Gulosibacter chungangensis]KAB1645025.1 ABC transporter permease [Gulosibacter chungangensis]